MTQKDKELLLRDLSARLPYGVKVHWNKQEGIQIVKVYRISTYGVNNYMINGLGQPEPGYEFDFPIEDCIPYLRPMASMTVEERLYFHRNSSKVQILIDEEKLITKPFYGYTVHLFDWLLKRHFDYHNLIGRGLALVAPEGMYK